MTAIIGEFVEPDLNIREYLMIGFSPSSVPLRQRWRNNSLSADFMADYVTTFFPADDDSAQYRRAEIKDAVSYIANELLENAMKFSADTSRFPVDITLYLHQDELRFYVTNIVDSQAATAFQALIEEILASDAEEMFFRQLEKNAAVEATTNARIGYLTMLNNYRTRLGCRFEPLAKEPASVAVTIVVRLDTENPLRQPAL
jgi:hypothetical protein